MKISAVFGFLAFAVVVVSGHAAAAPVETEEMQIAATTAQKIVRATGVRAGLCVHLPCGDGRLTAALGGAGNFLVHGLSVDRDAVETARQHIRSEGLYGRVSVERSSITRLPYADNVVNLLVAEDWPSVQATGLSFAEAMRVLAPRGAVCVRGNVAQEHLSDAGFVAVQTSGPWTVATKPRPAAMDDWPYYDHGTDGNPVSRDLLVGPAASLRWRTGPSWGFHGGNVVMGWVSANGRLFYRLRRKVGDGHRVANVLIGRDAHNGLLLWERPVEEWDVQDPNRSVFATADRLYTPLTARGPLAALDAATGEILKTYDAGGHPSQVILGAVDRRAGRLLMATGDGSCALDVESGGVLWRSDRGGKLAIGEGRLFVCGDSTVAALAPETGGVQWETAIPARLYKISAPCYYGGTLVLVTNVPGDETRKRLQIMGYAPKDGAHLWTYVPLYVWRDGSYMTAEVFGAQGLVWAHVKVEPNPEKNNTSTGKRGPSAWVGLDPATGRIIRRWDDESGDPVMERVLDQGIHRCTKGTATERFCLFGTYEFFDWATGKYSISNITRPACGANSGMLPANGLVYTPPFTCVCRTFMQRGFLALAHRPGGVVASADGRLETGPAMGAAVTATPVLRADEWPAYRGGPDRFGASATVVPAEVKPLWRKHVGSDLTPPVIAEGKVFVSSMDDYSVSALDATTGDVLWRFTASGRVDSPPTVDSGRVVFGCRDGWVYCLRVSDGVMVWRFRAAPAVERIVVDGRLESPWPVHGSVLIQDGIVYAAAGRHMNLDGGVTFYALDLKDGHIVWSRLFEKLPGDLNRTNTPVALLTADGNALYMGKRAFDAKTGTDAAYVSRGHIMDFGASGFLDNDWFEYDNTKNRLQWSDGRVSGDLLVSGSTVTCGVNATYRGNAPRAGEGMFHLFGKAANGGANWSVQVPVRMRALVLAGDTVFVAGRCDPDIPEIRGLQDRRRIAQIVATLPEERLIPTDAQLLAFSARDGKQLPSLVLDAPPVFDGLAAADGRLYVSCRDGSIHCLGR